MQGLKLLFWSAVYETYNAIVNPARRWEIRCVHCGETMRSRSYNGAITKESLHVHFADDHPGGPEDVDGDWHSMGYDPEIVRGTEPEGYDL